jgi:SAM-dependent methyltransferase
MTRELIRDIIQWDVASWSKALGYWEQAVDWSQVHHCLELGGREGGLSLWLALKNKQVLCSDLEKVELTASPLHDKYGVRALIRYQDIDATRIPFENHFDLIVFKSIIGGIGRKDNHDMQQAVFNEIHKALKPGGKLLFIENLIASPVHQKIRKLFIEWEHYWNYVSLEDLHQYLSPFASHEIKATGVLATFGRNEGQRKFLAAADKALFNHICPARWKYIAYGVAEKKI